MKQTFDEPSVLLKLKHYLPSQAPLKDFVHHNTLHSFQDLPFAQGIRAASKIFGYKVSLSLQEYRDLYCNAKIRKDVLNQTLIEKKGANHAEEWLLKLTKKAYVQELTQRIGSTRAFWKSHYQIDLDTIVHTNLFRILNSYLDQGVSVKKFPSHGVGLLSALRLLEKESYVSFFKTPRGKKLLLDEQVTITMLLGQLVGNQACYTQYLFDQQFAHPGWSGMIAVLEEQPHSLLDKRTISLAELVKLELILEVDNLEHTLGSQWKPLDQVVSLIPEDLFKSERLTELDEVLNIWQEVYEWSYYDEVLAGIQLNKADEEVRSSPPSFQAFFCIDDRECSIRRHIELFDPACETYGTPGHFAVDAFYQPKHGKFYTKICPAPLSPGHVLREVTTKRDNEADMHFDKSSFSLFKGWLISQTLGFWSAMKLMLSIFMPRISPASTSSFAHMASYSALTVENRSQAHQADGLQIGYTVEEMADRVEEVLKSTGLTDHFSSLIYIIGHGASSTNNTHYAGYDCGACNGRPGSVNARAFCYMANHGSVREHLKCRGIDLPRETEFLGGLHDTTRDEMMFYDEELLSDHNLKFHEMNLDVFSQALRVNAKERSRRFESIDSSASYELVHEQVKSRSASLFEPRPELNHATNALCIIGRKSLNKHLFLDRRSFLNSYNYQIDPEGHYLLNILKAAAPVCGGINLEYYFSRTDNERLGAGSKLPHNVMGLIGVSNGFEGDLRTGLPIQMVEVHDPLRLMIIVEHYPEVVLSAIQQHPSTYDWVEKEWIRLAVVHPVSKAIYRFQAGVLTVYTPLTKTIKKVNDLNEIFEQQENIQVFHLN